jgi:excisionase family DNA binding protein
MQPRTETPKAALWTWQEVCRYFRVTRRTLQRWVKDGTFPAPVRIGRGTVRWRAADVLKL